MIPIPARKHRQILVQGFMFLPVAVYLLMNAAGSQSSLVRVTGMVLAGAGFWTFAEYLIHRHLFHHDAGSATGMRLRYLYHGRHHQFPDDLERLAMSPAVTAPLGVLFYLLFRAALGADEVGVTEGDRLTEGQTLPIGAGSGFTAIKSLIRPCRNCQYCQCSSPAASTDGCKGDLNVNKAGYPVS